MKRKYRCQKVKVGDWVYVQDGHFEYDSKCKYKVIGIKPNSGIIVEVKDNEQDKSIILGWLTDSKLSIKEQYNLPSGIKAWFVYLWEKVGGKCLSIE